jgi:hypothetical protein
MLGDIPLNEGLCPEELFPEGAVDPIATPKPPTAAPAITPTGPPGIPAIAPTIAAAPAALATVAGAPAPETILIWFKFNSFINYISLYITLKLLFIHYVTCKFNYCPSPEKKHQH